MSASRSGVLWLLRVLWALQPFAFVPLLSDATSSLTGTGRIIAASFAWAAWSAVLLATLVPTTVSLTTGRLVTPMAIAVVGMGALGPPVSGWKLALGGALSLLATTCWFSAETGLAMAQGSAYGDEQRFPLKPPVPYLVPMIVSWLVTAGLALAGVLLLASGRWVVGVAAAAAGAALAAFVGPRFHQLSRRWLVVVPAGVVVHDPMLLVENALFRVSQLTALHLAPAGTEAADLTGGTEGVAIEIVLREVDTVVKVGARAQPAGAAVHVRSVLVSPSRPGRALRAAAARGLPVG